jgi:hypothetical protein
MRLTLRLVAAVVFSGLWGLFSLGYFLFQGPRGAGVLGFAWRALVVGAPPALVWWALLRPNAALARRGVRVIAAFASLLVAGLVFGGPYGSAALSHAIRSVPLPRSFTYDSEYSHANTLCLDSCGSVTRFYYAPGDASVLRDQVKTALRRAGCKVVPSSAIDANVGADCGDIGMDVSFYDDVTHPGQTTVAIEAGPD